MGNTVTIGGGRLGAGKKMTTSLKSYERSTHNLGYLWRSTMAPGTLVPFMVEPALPGDTWDIGLASEVLTLPTVGPLYGSFKLQLDVFQVPIRLYQAQLHNNKLYIGLSMDQIKLPQLRLKCNNVATTVETPDYNLQQINPSSLLAYLGIRGVGRSSTGGPETVELVREFDATPYLAYWDIYKNYYANKQEEIGYYIHNKLGTNAPIDEIENVATSETWQVSAEGNVGLSGSGNPFITAIDTQYKATSDNLGGFQEPLSIFLRLNGSLFNAYTVFNNVVIQNNGNDLIMEGCLGEYAGRTLDYIIVTASLVEGIITKSFPLENLDNMREDILAAIKTTTPFIIDQSTYEPYGAPLRQGTTKIMNSLSVMEGLAIKTYQSDIFNNWLSTEWIDGQNGINAITSIDTSEGKFSIDTLNLAKKVYQLLNDIAVSGGSYEDWIEASWDIEATRKAETPMYEGGLSKEVVFTEVIANASSNQTLDDQIEPLGTLGGRGVMGNKNKGGKLVIKVNEPSYIIGIVSLTPRIDYSQGNRWYTNLKTLNDFHKPALDQIGFQDLVTDQMCFWDTLIDPTTGAITFKSAGKQPAWINYQTNFNRTYGNFADVNKEMFMTLNRRYEPDENGGIKDLTTYIDPVKFNYAFAQTSLDAQNFWTHIAVDAEVRRKMSAKIMPNP